MFGLAKLAATERRERARSALARASLAEHADSYPHMLSGGEQQRAALARALAPQPELMLMDEPFSNLDRRLRDSVRDQTLDILRASGITTIIVTHDPEEALRIADRIVLMRKGTVVQTGTPQEMYRSPATLFAARFFSELSAVSATCLNGRADTPFGSFAALGIADGAPVTVGVRPESLEILLSGAADAGRATLPARIESVERLGNITYAYLDGGTPEVITVQVMGDADIASGQDVRVALRPGAIHLFDAKGAALAPAA